MTEIIKKLYGGEIEVKFLGPTEDKPNRHMYYVDGKRKTGVTTYIGIKDKSRPLLIWATELFRDFLLENVNNIDEEMIYKGCELHTERKKEAAAIGDEAHGWIEKYLKGKSPEMPERREAQIAVTSFLDWLKEEQFEILECEKVVYSKEHDYIGTFDIEATKNGKRYMIDIKTANGIYNDYFMQTAGYVKADEEESGKKYDGRYIVRLAKETEQEYIDKMEKKMNAREAKGKGRYEYPPYQVFEAMLVDDDDNHIDRDFKAFLSAKELFEWDKKTDLFTNKKK